MTTEIVEQRSAALAQIEQPDSSILTVMERLASNPNLDADKIDKLFNIFISGQRKMREMTDEQEFAHRMADFKKAPPEIIKSRVMEMRGEAKGSGKEYSLKVNYADLDAYASAIMAGLAERGITWSFPFSQKDNQITVSCILRYGLYQHTPTTMTGGPDTTGAKNAIQAIASTITYFERYTLCGATGFTAAMPDTDGNLNGLDPEDRDARLKAINTAPDLESLKRVYIAATKAASEAKDSVALEAFTAAKEGRKKGLGHA